MPDRHREKLDALALFRRAESFYFTVHFLRSQHITVQGQGSFALMTCAAFALEAYLKVLSQLQRDGPPLEGHNLRELFHDLSLETQKVARRMFLKAEGGPAEMKKRAREYQRQMPSYMKMPQSFEEALDLSANAFIEWRYNSTKPCHFHVGILLGYMRDEILKLEPDWRPYKGHPLTILNPHPDFAKPQDEESRKPVFEVLKPKPAAPNARTRNGPNPKDGRAG